MSDREGGPNALALVETTIPQPLAEPEPAGSAAHSLATQAGSSSPPPSTSSADADLIAMAKRAVADCRSRYARVRDYTCTFVKRERIGGRLSSYHILTMKARTRPYSVYFRFQKPTPGREAIYVAGRHGGRVLAHDVGLGKVLAGTLALDPKGARAMEDCRHPITESGLGHLIETVAERWEAELHPGESKVAFDQGARVGNRACTMIETTHPRRQPGFLFHKVKLYIDREHGLPVRFEAYDWPRRPGDAPELLEEYTFMNLRLDVGLRDRDFDPTNEQYSFGRF